MIKSIIFYLSEVIISRYYGDLKPINNKEEN